MPTKSRAAKSTAPSPSPAASTRSTRGSQSAKPASEDVTEEEGELPVVSEKSKGKERAASEEDDEEDAAGASSKTSMEDRMAKLKELRIRMVRWITPALTFAPS